MKLYSSLLTALLCLYLNTPIQAQSSPKSAFESSNLPIIVLTSEGVEIPSNPKIEIHMGIIDNGGALNHLTDPYNGYNGIIGVETRGSSSGNWPKKNYGLETRFADGTNQNVPLLGMPAENDWILHGPYSDKSLMRNALVYNIGLQAGRWAPRTRFCELFIDGTYKGVYVLLETIKRDGERVDISKLKVDEIIGDDLTGGYIIKVDRDDEFWTSPYSSPIGSQTLNYRYVYPDPDDMPTEQKTYIQNYVTDFEDALASGDFTDPDLGFRKYINTESFIDFFLFNELFRNVDAYRLSTYFYKDRDSKGGKLTMGPLWDFNLAVGNADYYDAFRTEGWMLHSVGEFDLNQPSFWWDRLRQDSSYNASLRIRWETLRTDILSYDNLEALIDSMATLLDEPQARNFETYDILGTYVWPNYFVANTYEQEIEFMKDWLANRLDWIDEQMDAIQAIKTQTKAINAYEIYAGPNPFTDELNIQFYALESCDVQITMSDVVGKIVYTHARSVFPGFVHFPVPMEGLHNQGGIYILQFRVDGEILRTQKLFKSF